MNALPNFLLQAVRSCLYFGTIAIAPLAQCASLPAETVTSFTDRYCSSCHNDVDLEGGFDLTSLAYAPADAANFVTWVKVHDRVQAG